MITLLNVGVSPFRVLFFLVMGIFVAVLCANLIAYVISKVIDKSTEKMLANDDKA